MLIPIPDYETVITPLDKYRTTQAAQRVGFPCPRTYLPESDEHLAEIAGELGFPLLVKAAVHHRWPGNGNGDESAGAFGEDTHRKSQLRFADVPGIYPGQAQP